MLWERRFEARNLKNHYDLIQEIQTIWRNIDNDILHKVIESVQCSDQKSRILDEILNFYVIN